MTKVRKWLTLLICGSLVILLAFLSFRFLHESEINYHLRKLHEAHLALNPSRNAFDALRRFKFTLGWKVPVEEFKKHQDALVRLGYFHNTNLAFATTNLLREFVAEIKNLPLTDTNWSYSIDGTNLLLTAAASEIPLWTITASNVNAMLTADHENQNPPDTNHEEVRRLR